MSIDLASLPEDVETLHALIGDLVRERDSARAEAEAEIARLRGILKTLQRMQFGRRSERLDPDQLQLGLEDVATDLADMEEAGAHGASRQSTRSNRAIQSSVLACRGICRVRTVSLMSVQRPVLAAAARCT